MNVSIATNPSGSPCSETDVRCAGTGSDVQMPIVYHFVAVRPTALALISIVIHVFDGVVAFHEATSSSKSNCASCDGESHVPSVAPLVSDRVPPALEIPAPGVPPLRAKRVKLICGAGSVFAANAGCARNEDATNATIAKSTLNEWRMVPPWRRRRDAARARV